jgi:hypothetical protein
VAEIPGSSIIRTCSAEAIIVAGATGSPISSREGWAHAPVGRATANMEITAIGFVFTSATGLTAPKNPKLSEPMISTLVCFPHKLLLIPIAFANFRHCTSSSISPFDKHVGRSSIPNYPFLQKPEDPNPMHYLLLENCQVVPSKIRYHIFRLVSGPGEIFHYVMRKLGPICVCKLFHPA